MCQGQPLIMCVAEAIVDLQKMRVEPYMIILTPQSCMNLDMEMSEQGMGHQRGLGLGNPPTFQGIPVAAGHDDMLITKPIGRVQLPNQTTPCETWDVQDVWAGRWFPIHAHQHMTAQGTDVWEQIADKFVNGWRNAHKAVDAVVGTDEGWRNANKAVDAILGDGI